MELKIAQLGQPVLRQLATEVPAETIRTPEFQQFLEDMWDTLEASGGVGLAAPQVFDRRRVFLAAIVPPETEDDDPGMEVLINPRVEPLSDEMAAAWEGCLSFSELLVLVPRYKRLRVDYLDADGEPRSVELADFPARVVQHELDHLDGVLTIDRAVSTRHIIKASEIDAVVKRPPPDA